MPAAGHEAFGVSPGPRALEGTAPGISSEESKAYSSVLHSQGLMGPVDLDRLMRDIIQTRWKRRQAFGVGTPGLL